MRPYRFWFLLAVLAMMAVASACAQTVPYSQYSAGHELTPRASHSAWHSEDGVPVPQGESVTVIITVQEDALWYPVMTYRMTENNILDNIYSLQLDGETPYTECATLSLDGLWLFNGVYEHDRYGNEVIGMPVKAYEMQTQGLMGRAALYAEGMGLYLTAGEHELTFTCKEGAFVLYDISLTVPAAALMDFAEDTVQKLTGSALISIQAESMPRRNNPNIRSASQYDTALTPYSGTTKVINYIEDMSYRYGGDCLYYDFTIAQEGWYGLALRARQAEKANFPVFRNFYIDGEIPSQSFWNAAFLYDLNFNNQIVKTEAGDTALMYLTAGTHTLCIQTSLNPVRGAIEELNRISGEMSALALELSKITGGNTDRFRDFKPEDFDFHIEDDLLRWIDELNAVYADLAALSPTPKNVGELSNIRVAVEALTKLSQKPNDLPKYLNEFASSPSSARAYVVMMVEQLNQSPLGLDSIHFFQSEGSLPKGLGFFSNIAATVQRFGASFGAQEYAAADVVDETHLQVWVARPRQYLEIMQRMADTMFTPQSGIVVDFSLMPDANKLILSNASGSAPDVAVAIASGLTYDLAVRGALADMRQFDTFKEVGQRFPAGLMIPGVCDNGMYALPETFNFTVLFYRKDILDSLNLTVPDSMEEVLEMLPILRRYGLNFNNFVANAIGYKGFSITTPYIFQSGGTLYQEGTYLSALGEEEALAGIRLLADSFVVYDMDYEIASFYQAFRDGTLPLGTGNYAMYNLLMNAAPEIADQWGIALYPGVTDADGVVQRWTSGAAESSVIFSSSDMLQESWDFLDWWMSDEVQTEFAYILQSTLGNEYLWNSANLNAFAASPWPAADKQVIAQQLMWTYEAPRTLGSYMVERELSNAINAIALDGKNLRSIMDEAIKRIDREVARKLEEFGRLEDGQLKEPLIVPTIDTVKGWLE